VVGLHQAGDRVAVDVGDDDLPDLRVDRGEDALRCIRLVWARLSSVGVT